MEFSFNPIKGYTYKDLGIIPKVVSNITSRKECNPYVNEDYLPIFAAPMSTIVNSDNYKVFINNKIIPIIPRNISLNDRLYFCKQGLWVAFGLDEIKKCKYDLLFSNEKTSVSEIKVCIDIANGHMQSLLDTIKDFKEYFNHFNKKIQIMAGNIANPETYKKYCEAGADYVRCSIGSGNCCITGSNTGIFYPPATLIAECNIIKKNLENENQKTTKIIADGGIKNYDDAIKALALGADFVMIGSLFSGFFESAADKYYKSEGPSLYPRMYVYENFKFQTYDNNVYNQALNFEKLFKSTIKIDKNPYPKNTSIEFDMNINSEFLKSQEEIKRFIIKNSFPIYKEIFGMSTKVAQKLIDKNKNITSEGVIKEIQIKYTIKQWTDNFISYLKSAMSYCNSKTLDDFIGEQDFIILSNGVFKTINK